MANEQSEESEIAQKRNDGAQWRAYEKEMRKWNKPYVFQRWPAMVYQAKKVNGKNIAHMPEPQPEHFKTDSEWRRAQEHAARFTQSCQRIVGNEEEYRRAVDEGWRDSPNDAVAHLNSLDDAIAKAAAHRHHEDKKLSPAAKAEADAVDAASYEHVPEIPAQPVKRRGRPKKNAAA